MEGEQAHPGVVAGLRGHDQPVASDVEKAPTVAAYIGGAKTGLHQNVRELDRSGRPDRIEWKNTNWKPLSQDSYRPTRDSDDVPKVREVLKTLDPLEHLVD